MGVLDKIELLEMLSLCMNHWFLPNEYIVKIGEASREIWILENGSVTVEKEGVFCITRDSPAMFGEMCIVSDAKRTANIIAQSFCLMRSINKSSVLNLFETLPDMRKKILNTFNF